MNILIHWKSEYDLGLKEIDQHHKKLVDLINVVYDSYIKSLPDNTISNVASEMTDYAFVHFKFEEKYFEKFGYENTEAHIKEHQYFISKIDKLQEDFWSQPAQKKMDALNFLKSWLEYHILNSDKKYVDCFVRNGMQAVS